jgi:hypothetical protein
VKEDADMTQRRKETSMVIGQTPLAGFGTVQGDAEERMTEQQAVILRELARQAGEPMDGGLTRAQAEERIAALKDRLGEG